MLEVDQFLIPFPYYNAANQNESSSFLGVNFKAMRFVDILPAITSVK